jgi:hypothetical protein
MSPSLGPQLGHDLGEVGGQLTHRLGLVDLRAQPVAAVGACGNVDQDDRGTGGAKGVGQPYGIGDHLGGRTRLGGEER